MEVYTATQLKLTLTTHDIGKNLQRKIMISNNG